MGITRSKLLGQTDFELMQMLDCHNVFFKIRGGSIHAPGSKVFPKHLPFTFTQSRHVSQHAPSRSRVMRGEPSRESVGNFHTLGTLGELVKQGQ